MMLVAILINIGLKSERDAARMDTRFMAGLYNGLLIGRGCEIPE